jgi:O-antigen/teichoic acid export membrane protein
VLRRLATNTLIGLAGTTAQKGLAFLTTLVLARGLGQDGFGTYAFVGVYMFFFNFLVDLGIERVVTRELSQTRQGLERLVGNAILLKLGLCAVAIPLAIGIASILRVSAETWYCIVLAAAGLPLSIDIIFRGYFQSQLQVKYIYAVTLPSAALFLCLAGTCVVWSLPVHAVFYAALLNGALTLSVLIMCALPYVRPVFRPEAKLMAALLRDAGEVGLFIALFVLAMRIDQILLFQLRGAVEVARYAVPVRLTEALSILPEALMLTVFPVLAGSQHTAPDRFHHTYRLSFKYLSAIIAPVALVLTVLRYEIVVFLFGPQYASSATPLAILGWGMFFGYTGAVYLNLFIVQRQQRLLLLVSVVALAVNLASNLLLIPAYGATGAALAMVIGNGAGFACWVAHRETRPFMLVCMAEALRPLAAVLIACGGVVVLPVEALTAAVIALALYVGGMMVLGGFSRSDIALVRELFAPGRAA